VVRRLVLLSAVSSALAGPGAIPAHEGDSHTGFAARVSVIDPFLPGLLVQVLGGHERLSVTNLTDKRIVILDEGDEPFVRIGPGKTVVWSEPRIGATEEPPEDEGLVRNWRIEGTADGEPFEIVGFLGYRPPAGAGAEDGSGFPAWAIVLLGAAGALVAGTAIALRVLRRKTEEAGGRGPAP
jgi:hypothetical protein